jgi:hypothetical protein
MIEIYKNNIMSDSGTVYFSADERKCDVITRRYIRISSKIPDSEVEFKLAIATGFDMPDETSKSNPFSANIEDNNVAHLYAKDQITGLKNFEFVSKLTVDDLEVLRDGIQSTIDYLKSCKTKSSR